MIYQHRYNRETIFSFYSIATTFYNIGFSTNLMIQELNATGIKRKVMSLGRYVTSKEVPKN